jgi:hypothetical protein
MKKTENTSRDAKRYPWQFLSGTNIKIIGIVLMTLDHLHQMFIAQGAPALWDCGAWHQPGRSPTLTLRSPSLFIL